MAESEEDIDWLVTQLVEIPDVGGGSVS